MSHPLVQAFADRLKTGLRRQSLTTASRWACEHRVMGGKSFPGPWTFKHHPWLKDMHDSKAISNVGQKSAQMGYTETVLNKVFFEMDVNGVDCLYVLPNQRPDASDFSSSRFDPALELSPHLMKLFSEVKNVGHKRAGSANLYIRGSNSRAGLKSIPTGLIIFDEVDEMELENIPLAMERASGQIEKQDWKISTPTIHDTGINHYFNESTQEHFHFKCPMCNQFIELIFPESIIITATELIDPKIEESHLICMKCKGKLHHLDKINFLSEGRWEPLVPTSNTRGFYINQLYSMAMSPVEIARAFIKSQTNAAAEQEFYNSKLGLPHVVSGSQVDDGEINKCIGNFKKIDNQKITRSHKIITMGVDVGRWFHIEVDEWDIPRGCPISDANVYSRPSVIWQGKYADITGVDRLMQQLGVHYCVIDAQPERRIAMQFAIRHWGRVKMCFYYRSSSIRNLVPSPEIEQAIQVDRTSWLDLSLGRFHRGQEGILLPMDTDQEYKDHIKAQVRIYQYDNDGNAVSKYVTPTGKADHYGHARNYAEIAFSLALGVGPTTDIQNPV